MLQCDWTKYVKTKDNNPKLRYVRISIYVSAIHFSEMYLINESMSTNTEFSSKNMFLLFK